MPPNEGDPLNLGSGEPVGPSNALAQSLAADLARRKAMANPASPNELEPVTSHKRDYVKPTPEGRGGASTESANSPDGSPASLVSSGGATRSRAVVKRDRVSRETPGGGEVEIRDLPANGVGKGRDTRFYETMKAAHARGAGTLEGYMRLVEEEYAYALSAKAAGGDVKVVHPLEVPTYRWAMEYAGKFAHSPAPKQVQMEARILVKMDLDEE